METVGTRVRTARKAAGLTQIQLAKKAQLSQATITNLENDRNKDSKHLVRIAEILTTTYEYLRYGQKNVKKTNDFTRGIPLISLVQAGNWTEAVDNYAIGDAEEWLPSHPSLSSGGFALRVIGSSMTSPYVGGRSYPEGSIIYVDPYADGPYEGKRVVVKVDGETTFKELVNDSGRLMLRPINPQFPMMDFPDDAQIVGVVVGSYYPE